MIKNSLPADKSFMTDPEAGSEDIISDEDWSVSPEEIIKMIEAEERKEKSQQRLRQIIKPGDLKLK